MIQDSNGTTYILSDNNLHYYKSGKLIHIPSLLNLSSADLFISKNHLILIGSFGIAISHLNKLRLGNFSIAVNYKKFYKNIKSSYVDNKGLIYLVTDQKCYTVSLDSLIKDPKLLPSQQIDIRFHLINRSYQNLKNIDTFLLSEKHERLILGFINHLGTGNTQLFFRRENGKWQKASSNEILTEGIMPDRFYQFQYYLQDDFWRSRINTLYVLQMPKWYQRFEWQITFWIMSFLLFATSIFAATSVTRKLVTKANEKRRLQTELELRAIHSQINPHFIFNTLSTALYFISKQQTKDAYEHVSKFSKLLRNYLKSSRDRFITLADEIEILRQYIELQRARFNKAFHYEIHVEPEIFPKNLLLPSLLLQPLVENAINHGLFNKGDKGYLKISFHKGTSETELICIIDDNGIGRTKAKAINKKFKKEKRSYGTALTRELIDIFKRYEHMDIDLKYIDKSEPETGTTVQLTIRNMKIATM